MFGARATCSFPFCGIHSARQLLKALIICVSLWFFSPEDPLCTILVLFSWRERTALLQQFASAALCFGVQILCQVRERPTPIDNARIVQGSFKPRAVLLEEVGDQLGHVTTKHVKFGVIIGL